MQQALDIFRSAQSFLLTGHERPDGDCLGSQAALFHVLRAMGKDVAILNPDPPTSNYRLLVEETPFGTWDETRKDGGAGDFDVAVLLDSSVLSRSGPVGRLIKERECQRVQIDHHQPSDEDTWNAQVIDMEAASTGTIVRRMARELDVDLSLEAARGVFVTLVTDTGWFRYPNTSPEALQLASEMVDLGVDPAAAYGCIFQSYSGDYPTDLGRMLSDTRMEAEGRLAVVSTMQNGELPDSNDILDVLRAVGSVEVAAFIRQKAGGKVKLSLRSKADFDVHAVAARFGGGGHVRASGATLDGSLEEATELVVAAILEDLEG